MQYHRRGRAHRAGAVSLRHRLEQVSVVGAHPRASHCGSRRRLRASAGDPGSPHAPRLEPAAPALPHRGPRSERGAAIEVFSAELSGLHEEIARAATTRAALTLRLTRQEELNRELIHRVKNNLTLLVSFVRATRRKADPAAEEALAGFEQRLMAIAAVHEVLDATRATDAVRADQMLRRVVQGLADALAPQGVRVEAALDPVILHATQAVPLSLAVNELVTNALKHAFPGGRAGAVTIALRQLHAGRCEAVVSDDGIGAPDAASRSGSGARIVGALAEQLGARLEVERGGGTTFRLTFVPCPAG